VERRHSGALERFQPSRSFTVRRPLSASHVPEEPPLIADPFGVTLLGREADGGLRIDAVRHRVSPYKRRSAMSELFISSDPELPPEVLDALSRNRKIEAIKLLRESHNMDLKSAKETIEHYERTHVVPKRQEVSGMITEDRTTTKLIWIIVLAAIAAGAYFVYGSG
jgi:hypothetical protein